MAKIQSDIDDIKEIVLVDNKNLGISRISGTGTDNLCKGNYMIEENKCKVELLNKDKGYFIYKVNKM